MPTFKNIRVPVGKSGKTRLQRVQVLKSGKYKFVKNLPGYKRSAKMRYKRSKVAVRKRRSGNPKRNVRKTGKGKLFRTVGAAGAAEDIAWGFIGFNLLGRNVVALPMTRVIQGIAGYALDRRGKNRAVLGILDLITLWLNGAYGNGRRGPQGSLSGALVSLQQMAKIRPL